MSSKVRINISNNEKVTDKRAVIVSLDLDDICKQARNKLNIKKKITRVFNGKTGEIITHNDQLRCIEQDDLIVVSTSDKPFQGKVATSSSLSSSSDGMDTANIIVHSSSSSSSIDGASCTGAGTTSGGGDDAIIIGAPESTTVDPVGLSNDALMNELKKSVQVHIVAKDAWLEDEAINQLNRCAKTLKGVRYAVGMPDLHPGKGFPIGASFATRDYVFPACVGGDIGCGMTMMKTELTDARIKLDNWANKLYGLETGGFFEDDDMSMEEWLQMYGVEPTSYDLQLGTIGGGNHFAELQQVEKVVDQQLFDQAGLTEHNLYLLIHSGSRGYGHHVVSEHMKQYGTKGLHEQTEACTCYLHLHDNACNWAKANRHLIARKFLMCLSTKGEVVLDVWHNNVTKKEFIASKDDNSCGETEELWLHRKGAAPTDQGLIVIPGSRGTYSYLVAPVDDQQSLQAAAYSAAHGAGRKWNRSKAYAMSKNNPNQTPDSLSVTELGSRVICEDHQLIYEEHPFAYKDIDDVVKDLEAFNVVKIVAILKPLITYKTRNVKSK